MLKFATSRLSNTTRHIEDVSEILWGSSVSASTVSNRNEKSFKAVEAWRSRPLERAHPYACVDGICLKRSWEGSYEKVAVMVAIGANDDGYHEALGAAEGLAESSECRREPLSRLKPRGLRGARMLAGDKAAGMVSSIAEVFPEAAYQRRAVHFYRNMPAKVPKTRRAKVAATLKAIHAMESREAAEAKALEMASELRAARLSEAAEVVMDGCAETLAHARFPRVRWRRIRTNNAIGYRQESCALSDSPIGPPSGAATPPAESRPGSASNPTRSRPRT